MSADVKKFYFFVLFVMTVLTDAVCAHIGISQVDGKSAGIPGGLVAVADDAFSIQYNPAGLSRIPYPDLFTGMGTRSVHLRDGTNMQESLVGFAYPFKRSLPWKKDTATFVDQTVALGMYQFSSGSAYGEQIMYLSYARQIYPRIAVGVTLKQLQRIYKSDLAMDNAVDAAGNRTGISDPLFDNGTSCSAITGDLGILCRFGSFTRYAIGFSLRNITQPDLAVGTVPDKVPLAAAAGFAYRFPKMNVSVDWMRSKLLGNSTDNRITFLGDRWFLIKNVSRVAARGLFGIGSRNYRAFGLGGSYLYNQFKIDYGFSFPLSGVERTMGTHQVNLSFRFGVQDPEEYFSPELKKQRMLRRLAEKELARARDERKHAEAMKRKAQEEIEAMQKVAFELDGKKAEKRAQLSENKLQGIYEEIYRTVLEIYDRKKAEGLSAAKRKILLERTVKEFKPLIANVSAAEKELQRVTRESNKLKEEYKLTFYYYKKVAERGASVNERLNILEKIMKKYLNLGIDLSEVEEEIKKLMAE